MRLLVACVLVFSCLGCASSERDAPATLAVPVVATGTLLGTVNAECPMMPDAGIDGVTVAEYHGMRIGFCCSDCLGAWQRLGDAERDAKLRRVVPE